ncbi:MAG: tetratricopeptide repeat protein, partial [Planctomycetales bacterium]
EKSKGRWKEAGELLLAAAVKAGRHPLAPRMLYHAGDAFHQAKQWKEAVSCYRLVVTKWSSSPLVEECLYRTALAAEATGDPDAVAVAVQAILAKSPDGPRNGEVRLAWARSLLKQQRHEEVVRVLSPILDDSESRFAPEARYLAAAASHRQRRYEDAARHIERLFELDKPNPKLQGDALLLQGATLTAAMKYRQALAPLESYLEKKPTKDGAAQGLAQLALCHAHMKNFESAQQRYAELIQRDADPKIIASLTHQLAEVAYIAKNYQWSGELFRRLSGENNTDELRAKGLSGLGWCWFQQREYEAAARALEDFCSQFPEDPQVPKAWMLRAQSLERLQRPADAVKSYEAVVKDFSRSRQYPEALAAAARLHDQLGADDLAGGLYQKLVDEHPALKKLSPQTAELQEYLYQFAWVLVEAQKPSDAAKQFQRIHQEFPNSRYWADATYWLAERAYQQGDYSRCDEIAERLTGPPADAAIQERAAYLQGLAALADQRWSDVASRFASLASRFPESGWKSAALYWAAEAEFKQDNLDLAEVRFDAFLQAPGERDPNLDAKGRLRSAQIRLRKKDYSAAEKIASQIAGICPDFSGQVEADYVLGRCRAASADFDGAREHYRRVVASPMGGKTETAAIAQWMIGETYFHQKYYEQAVREYLRVEILYDYPAWRSAALLQTGKCYLKLGEIGEAKKMLQRLVDQYPRQPHVEEALRLMAETRSRSATRPNAKTRSR